MASGERIGAGGRGTTRNHDANDGPRVKWVGGVERQAAAIGERCTPFREGRRERGIEAFHRHAHGAPGRDGDDPLVDEHPELRRAHCSILNWLRVGGTTGWGRRWRYAAIAARVVTSLPPTLGAVASLPAGGNPGCCSPAALSAST